MSSYPYQTEETLCGLFFAQASILKTRTFLRSRFRDGVLTDRWVDISWSEAADEVRLLGAGLIDLGIKKDDRIGLFAHNRPRWILCDQAILSVGAIEVPIYPTSTDDQLAYILNDCGTRGLVVDDVLLMEQAIRVKDKVPSLEFVVCMSPLETPPADYIMDYDRLKKKGEASESAPAEFDKRLRAGVGEDIAFIIYTSGTTGPPKGVILTHSNLMTCMQQILDGKISQKMLERGLGFHHLVHLPLCHVYGRTNDYDTCLSMGGIMSFAESIQTVQRDLLEIRPTMMSTIPRLYEKVYEAINLTVDKMKGTKKKMFLWALGVGNRAVDYLSRGERMPITLSAQYALASILVYQKVKKAAGMDRLVLAASGGGPLSKEINIFFRSLNIQMSEGYGLTETSPVLTWNAMDITMPVPDTWFYRKLTDWLMDTMVVMQGKGKNPFAHPVGLFKMMVLSIFLLQKVVSKPGAVGQVMGRTEIKIAPDGEILAKGPQVFDRDKGYYGKPDLTKEAFTEDGFFITGDIGHFDDDGFLIITDRKKELLVTSGGKNVAPHPIELSLTLDPYVEQAVALGDSRKYISALIVPNFPLLEKWAEKHGIKYADNKELIENPEVIKMYEGIVDKVNEKLARYEQLKKFRLLPAEFTEDTGELTPTLKIKRRIVYDKYGKEIESLYK